MHARELLYWPGIRAGKALHKGPQQLRGEMGATRAKPASDTAPCDAVIMQMAEGAVSRHICPRTGSRHSLCRPSGQLCLQIIGTCSSWWHAVPRSG